jgi:hypothetical protein
LIEGEAQFTGSDAGRVGEDSGVRFDARLHATRGPPPD